jgi:hypothetical protein
VRLENSALFCDEVRDAVYMSTLDHRYVEELGVLFPLLKPLYPGFFPPEGLLLCAPFIQLLFYQSFLLFKFLCEALIFDLDLEEPNLIN